MTFYSDVYTCIGKLKHLYYKQSLCEYERPPLENEREVRVSSNKTDLIVFDLDLLHQGHIRISRPML